MRPLSQPGRHDLSSCFSRKKKLQPGTSLQPEQPAAPQLLLALGTEGTELILSLSCPNNSISPSAQHCQAGKEPKKLPMSHRWLCLEASSHAAQEAHGDWGTLPAHWHPRKLRLALNLQH